MSRVDDNAAARRATVVRILAYLVLVEAAKTLEHEPTLRQSRGRA